MGHSEYDPAGARAHAGELLASQGDARASGAICQSISPAHRSL